MDVRAAFSKHPSVTARPIAAGGKNRIQADQLKMAQGYSRILALPRFSSARVVLSRDLSVATQNLARLFYNRLSHLTGTGTTHPSNAHNANSRAKQAEDEEQRR